MLVIYFQAPYTIVTLGGAVNYIYDIARQDESLVHDIIAIEPFKADFALRAYSNVTKWTGSQIQDFLKRELIEQYLITSAANGIGIPFGLLK